MNKKICIVLFIICVLLICFLILKQPISKIYFTNKLAQDNSYTNYTLLISQDNVLNTKVYVNNNIIVKEYYENENKSDMFFILNYDTNKEYFYSNLDNTIISENSIDDTEQITNINEEYVEALNNCKFWNFKYMETITINDTKYSILKIFDEDTKNIHILFYNWNLNYIEKTICVYPDGNSYDIVVLDDELNFDDNTEIIKNFTDKIK